MNIRMAKLFVVFMLSILVTSTAAYGQDQVAVEKLDINVATRDQLMKLPGITAAISQKIIDSRPYQAKSDLIEKKIVSASTYADITNLIVAKPPKSAPANGR